MASNGRKSAVLSLMESGQSEAGWILTYADLVTLLLVFFVLLFSISSLDLQRFRQVVDAMKKSFGSPTAVVELVVPDQSEAPKSQETDREKKAAPVEDFEDLKARAREEYTEEMRQKIREDVEKEIREETRAELLEEMDNKLVEDVRELVEKIRQGDNIVVTKERNRITITVEGQVFFSSGVADLNPEALPILDEIALIIMKYPDYRVNIRGHTDDRPINTPVFPSNWELSAVRATTVLRYLITQGVNPLRLTATGYGELLPLAANDNPENRARNRRVEFVLEKEKGG